MPWGRHLPFCDFSKETEHFKCEACAFFFCKFEQGYSAVLPFNMKRLKGLFPTPSSVFARLSSHLHVSVCGGGDTLILHPKQISYWGCIIYYYILVSNLTQEFDSSNQFNNIYVHNGYYACVTV